MRAGGESFADPAEPAQRRYEALRAYLLEQQSAVVVAQRFGYSTATVRQMAADWRAGRLEVFRSAKPGPKGPRKQPQVRDRVLVLRAQGWSVTQIAATITGEGTPVSHDTVWQMLRAEGLERLPARAGPPPPSDAPPRTPAIKAKVVEEWPDSGEVQDIRGGRQAARGRSAGGSTRSRRACTIWSLESPSAAYSTILARPTSQYADVYRRTAVFRWRRSSSHSTISYGLVRGMTAPFIQGTIPRHRIQSKCRR